MLQQIKMKGGLMQPFRTAIICLVLCLTPNVRAQAPDTLWTRYFNDGLENGNHAYRETCSRLIQTQDGGFFIGGRTYAPVGNRQRYPAYYVVKTDSDGFEEWSRNFDISRLHDILGGIVEGVDGQFFIAGRVANAEPYSANIVKCDSNGDSLSSTDYGNGQFYNVINTLDGNILACGDSRAHLVKITEAEELIWRRNYDGSAFVDVSNTIDSGYVAVGDVWPNFCWIVKVNGDGEQEWLRTYNFSDSTELLLSVVEVPGGGYLAGGWYDGYHSLLARFDSNGDTVWVRKDIPQFEEPVKDIVAAPGGGYVIVGGNGGGFNDYAVMRIDDLGEEVWQMEIEFDDDSPFDEATSVLALDDGGYLIGGNRCMRWDGQYSAGLMRTEPDTVILPFELEALEDGYDFGDSVMVDSVAIWELPLHNFGRRYVVIDSVAMTGDSSAFTHDMELPLYLYPPDTTHILVGFSPDSAGDYAAELSLFYGDSQSVEVNLTGRGLHLSVHDDHPLPTEFALDEVYPNPFNSGIQIRYALPHQMLVKVTVHDVSGREVVHLFDGTEQAGILNRTWVATNMPAGIYFIKVAAGSEVATTKVTLLK